MTLTIDRTGPGPTMGNALADRLANDLDSAFPELVVEFQDRRWVLRQDVSGRLACQGGRMVKLSMPEGR